MTDSPSKDELRDRRRDEALARRVGDALDQLAQSGAPECLDPELIAAYNEKSLEADEIVRCETHFAACARCRTVLRVLSASAETPLDAQEVGRLGTLVASTRLPLEAAARTTKRAPRAPLNWRTRWLAPALGVAAVLAVWFAMRPPWRTADDNSSTALIAQAPKAELPQRTETRDTQRLDKAPPRDNAETELKTFKEIPAKGAESAKVPADSPAKKEVGIGDAIVGTPNSALAENALRDEKKDKVESNGPPAVGAVRRALDTPAPAPRFAAPPPPAALPPPAAAPPPPPPVSPGAPPDSVAGQQAPLGQPKAGATNEALTDNEKPRSTSQSVAITSANPLVETTNSTIGGTLQNGTGADLPLNGRNYSSLLKLNPGAELYVLLKPPSGKILWKAGKGGTIAGSSDAGATFVPQASPLHEDWLAGAAVSDRVCWVVGRNGAIARTTDGMRWKKIAPPPMAAGASGQLPDWDGIVADDAKKATVTGSDGSRFATENAGKTWKAQ